MKKAFTLTELIITLTIVGVIAAIVIPSLVHQYRMKVLSVQLKQTYEQIMNAAKTAMAEENLSDFYKTTAGSADSVGKNDCSLGSCYFLTKYFKTKNSCLYDWNESEHLCSMNSYDADLFWGNCVELQNGAIVCMRFIDDIDPDYHQVIVDVNGEGAPNSIGIDTFGMIILSDGNIRDSGFYSVTSKCSHKGEPFGKLLTNSAGTVHGCLQQVIENNWKITED